MKWEQKRSSQLCVSMLCKFPKNEAGLAQCLVHRSHTINKIECILLSSPFFSSIFFLSVLCLSATFQHSCHPHTFLLWGRKPLHCYQGSSYSIITCLSDHLKLDEISQSPELFLMRGLSFNEKVLGQVKHK